MTFKMTQTLANNTAQGSAFLPLIKELCEALAAEGINYCHWKSNVALDRSASGENDLDLLISRADASRFTAILYHLGFKEAVEVPEKRLPGILDYYGYDLTAQKIVHVHAHYQLILGHDATKNYRLPIEEAFLASAMPENLFRVPSPEFEFIVFVIRMVLKHSTWDTMLSLQGKLNKTEPQELAYLLDRIDRTKLSTLLEQYLPYLSLDLFDRCVQVLQPHSSVVLRIQVGQQLQHRLKAHARRASQFSDTSLKLWRRVVWGVKRRLKMQKKRLAIGGAMVAIVGGDGAGKSTVVDELDHWLSRNFDTTRVHLGKPPWSLGTFLSRGAHKAGRLVGLIPKQEFSVHSVMSGTTSQFPGYLWILREVFTAWDRYRLYIKARRFATNGGLVVCDRFPLSQIKRMDGIQAGYVINPQQHNWFIRLLLNQEAKFYQHIQQPDILIVLRVDPEVAVARRAGEDPDWIRGRSQEIWEIDWQTTSAYVVDSGRSKAEVLADIKAFVWSRL